jgi:uncharacterized protein (TIGR02145 family)/uncharacterized repeat protein (TIGR02543 family)
MLKYFSRRFAVLIFLLAVAVFFSSCEKVPDYCSRGNRYDPARQFCFAGKAWPLCNNGDYNPLTEGCDPRNNLVGTMCAGGDFVSPGTHCGGYTLTTGAAPENGGIVTRFPNRESYAAREQVALSATAADGYTFVGWAGAQPSQIAAVTLTMDANKPMVAMFRPTTSTLATTAFPPDGGTIERVENGMHVTVTATTRDGYTFAGWSGASSSTQATITVTVDEGKTLVAMFTPNRYTLTVNTIPANSGTVFVNRTAASGVTTHDAGAQVGVLARATEGYEFVGWTGALTSAETGITVTMNGNRTLTANFQRGESGGVTHTHTWGTWEVVTPATCTAEGSRRRRCTSCGDTENQVIPRLPASDPACQISTYTITFNPNNGSVTPMSAMTDASGRLTSLPTPARTGFAFDGWFTAATGGTQVTASTVFTANTTVFAQWTVSGSTTPGDTGTFIDSRDGQQYRWVTIGTQTWMAENLNFDTTGSVCYDNDPGNCDIYGRLYDWATVMGFASTCNSTSCASQVESPHHRGICPPGWHVPSDAEWTTLVDYAGGVSVAGTKLKSTSGWNSGGNGTNETGFSALPGGTGWGSGFYDVGNYGYWWSATEYYAIYARGRYMHWNLSDVIWHWDNNARQFSVRCAKD